MNANFMNSCNGSRTASSALVQQTARELGMPIGLYTDLAVGIDRHGADAWSQQDAVLADVAMGAPPDELNHAGAKLGLGAVQSACVAGV